MYFLKISVYRKKNKKITRRTVVYWQRFFVRVARDYFSSESRQIFSISALTREMSVAAREAEYFFLNEELMFFGQAFLEKRISGSMCRNEAISSMTCGGGKRHSPFDAVYVVVAFVQHDR